MEQNPRGRGLKSATQPSHAGEVELAHDGMLRPSASPGEAGDGRLFPDVPCCVGFTVKPSFPRREVRREHNIHGLNGSVLSPGRGYKLSEVARFLRRSESAIRAAAKSLGMLRRLPRDRRYRPLSRAQTKRLIQHCRAM
jgi:hypothetical protein